jgi:hypothetical protein
MDAIRRTRAALLNHVGQLVRQQAPAVHRVRLVVPVAEHDILSDRVGARLHRCR